MHSKYISSFCLVLNITLGLLTTGCVKQCNNANTSLVSVKEPTSCLSCPKLSEGQDSLHFAIQVTQFIGKHADTGLLPNEECDSYEKYAISELPVEKYLQLFERNEGTASCGLAAAMVNRILMDNGIDAYCYSFGFPEIDLSHMVVITKIDGHLYLFDPFTNFMLANQKGDALPLDQFFCNVLDSTYQYSYALEPVETDLTIDFSLIDTTGMLANESEACKTWSRNFVRLEGETYQNKIRRSYNDDINNACNSFIKRVEKKLRKETTLRTFGQAMLVKNGSIQGAKDYKKIDSLINKMIAAQASKWNYRK